jgi:hypothetical protein
MSLKALAPSDVNKGTRPVTERRKASFATAIIRLPVVVLIGALVLVVAREWTGWRATVTESRLSSV